VHHPGAGHRVDESGLLAACNTPSENIQTSVSAIDTESCFVVWEIRAASFGLFPACPQCELGNCFHTLAQKMLVLFDLTVLKVLLFLKKKISFVFNCMMQRVTCNSANVFVQKLYRRKKIVRL